MFVDNLLLFAKAHHSSVSIIIAAFSKFSKASGLEASIEKSNVYIAGVSDEEARDIATVVHLCISELLFRY